jgi:GMP synthase-like glutamine amidotransferase
MANAPKPNPVLDKFVAQISPIAAQLGITSFTWRTVHDERVPWIADDSTMVRHALDSGLGVLGVCFGGQLLAQALGGTVARSTQPEIGWCDVHTDNPGLVPAGPWFQWHFDRLTAPPGAVEVARNGSATQAYVKGRALGLQFHPEVDTALVEQWIDEDGGSDMTRLGLDAAELRARTAELADGAAGRLRLLVAGFLGLRTDDADRLG